MKMKTENDVTYSNSKHESKKFTIASSTKAFKILSNNLYKNKILAIVRELSCNALDAHKLNGNTEPFEIKVPDALDNSFIIRDFGPGLSHEDMEHLYTTYFASTKSDSNEFTGALGLGSKSPFSYTSGFTVISYFNGQASLYSVYLESGEPTIQLIHKEASSEKSGIKITIPVQSNDLGNWRSNIARALIPIDPKLFKFSTESQIIEIDHISVVDYNFLDCSFAANINALYGNIIYPISISDIGLTVDDIPWIDANKKKLFVEFNLGELDIAPSREELSYDEDTVNVIKNKLLEIENTIRNFHSTIEDVYKSSPRAVLRYYNELSYRERSAFQKSFKFDGKDFEDILSYYKMPVDLTNYIESSKIKLYHIHGYKIRMSYSGDRKTKITLGSLLNSKYSEFKILIKNKNCKKPLIRLSEGISTACGGTSSYSSSDIIFIIEEDDIHLLDYIKNILKGETLHIFESKDINVKSPTRERQTQNKNQMVYKQIVYPFHKSLVDSKEIEDENNYWIRKGRGNNYIYNDISIDLNEYDIARLVRDYLGIKEYLILNKAESSKAKGKNIIDEIIKMILSKADTVYNDLKGSYNGSYLSEYKILLDVNNQEINKKFGIEKLISDTESREYDRFILQLRDVRHLDSKIVDVYNKILTKSENLNADKRRHFDKTLKENSLLKVILNGYEIISKTEYNLDNLKQDIVKLEIL